MVTAHRQATISQFTRMDALGMFHVKHFPVLFTALPPLAAIRTNAPRCNTQACQAGCSVVGTQAQAIFSAGGQHPVGLGNALQSQVIHHHRDIAVRPVKRGRPPAQRRSRCLQSRDEALRSGFFISGGAVDLACAIQAGYRPHLQIRRQRARINVVILYSIARLHNRHPLAPRHGAHHGFLHINR